MRPGWQTARAEKTRNRMEEKRPIISRPLHALVVSVAALAVGLAAISQQSLWMDEGSTAFKALMPTFKEWLGITYHFGGSDVQMPFYMVSVWAWVKAGLLGEFAMRSINLPFLVLMALALRNVRFWPLVCLISPFVLYYVGELRPYTMQMAGGAVMAAGLGAIISNRQQPGYRGIHVLAAGAMILTLGSLTSAVWAAGGGLALVILRSEWLRQKGFWFRVAPWGMAALIVLGYYVHTLQQGYRATASGGGGLLSIGFGFYEIGGLLGIGPSRNELRSSPLSLIGHAAWLVPACLCIAGAWILGIREWISRTDRRAIVAVSVAVLLPLASLALVGFLEDFRVLGRHLSPAIPAVLLPLALCWQVGVHKNMPALVLAATSSVVLLVSSLCLRFQEKHARDDYRTATTLAIDSLKAGKRVLWQADMNSPRYYAYKIGGMAYVNAIQQLESDPPGLLFADMVVVNRPDIRFKGIDYLETLRKNNFKLQSEFTGFQIWTPAEP
jgi:hypothetical protein